MHLYGLIVFTIHNKDDWNVLFTLIPTGCNVFAISWLFNRFS